MTDISHATDKERAASEAEEFLSEVEHGMAGGNIGLKIKYRKIQSWVHGLHRRRYYLFGADSGVGKTTLADDLLLDAWEDAKMKKMPFKVLYYSLEISRKDKIAKWVARRIYRTTGRSLPADYILNRIEEVRLTTEDRQLVQDAMEWIKEVLEDILIIDIIKHPTAMLNDVIHEVGKYGKIEYVIGKDGKEYIKTYAPDNVNSFFFWVIDHLALINEEAGLSLKQTIDRTSKYAVLTRNKLGVSPFFIQQFSTDMQSAERTNKGNVSDGSLAPQRLDFGDSKYTYRDADVVYGMIKPMQFDKDRFMGYELRAESNGQPMWGDYFVSLFLMKNRFGTENRVDHLILNGMASTFIDEAPDRGNFLAMEEMNDTLKTLETWQSHYQPQL